MKFNVQSKGNMKNAVFLDVAPCSSCESNRYFGGTCRLHLQGRKIHERGTSVSRCQPTHAGGVLWRDMLWCGVVSCGVVRRGVLW
jgi:hypothetical protein